MHEPQLIRLLPVEADDAAHETDGSEALMTYEPSEEEALDMIIPKYVCSLVYGALIESVASEMVPECRQWIVQQAMQKR